MYHLLSLIEIMWGKFCNPYDGRWTYETTPSKIKRKFSLQWKDKTRHHLTLQPVDMFVRWTTLLRVDSSQSGDLRRDCVVQRRGRDFKLNALGCMRSYGQQCGRRGRAGCGLVLPAVPLHTKAPNYSPHSCLIASDSDAGPANEYGPLLPTKQNKKLVQISITEAWDWKRW